MNHVITFGDLVHWGLFTSFLGSLLVVAAFWLYAFAAGMSDAPTQGPSRFTALAVHLMPIAFFAAWWLT